MAKNFPIVAKDYDQEPWEVLKISSNYNDVSKYDTGASDEFKNHPGAFFIAARHPKYGYALFVNFAQDLILGG